MRDFLSLLTARYRAALASDLDADKDDVDELREAIASLALAESALDKVSLCERYPQRPLQLVVIGPTQVGKSTMVNQLLHQQLAEASPMAGFTVHLQGYAVTDRIADPSGRDWSTSYFREQSARAQQALDREILDEYSITDVESVAGNPFVDTVVWDTPDFDSVASFNYRRSVLHAVSLADLIVFVVSKEKYADKTVWQFLSLLHQLNARVLLVMNKTPVEVREQLADSVTRKYTQLLAEANEPRKSTLPQLLFLDDYGLDTDAAMVSAEMAGIRATVSAELLKHEKISRDCVALRTDAVRFMQSQWSLWTAPLDSQLRLRRDWKNHIDTTCDDLLKRYRTEYLDHSRYRETFQLALAELLVLLEVPGMAEPLGKIRNLVTWPVRKLLSTARESRTESGPKDERTEERRVLDELGEHGMTRLASQITLAPTDRELWQQVGDNFAQSNDAVLEKYQSGLDNYQTLLQVEIERAAHSLYRRLQEQPATLNGLRAARVSADAAAVVLAVKSGGLGAADLIIAPAMLSLTTMLTEGALGQYMQTVQDDLRRYQEKEVASLISRKLRTPLYPLSAVARQEGIPEVAETELRAAQEKLERGDV